MQPLKILFVSSMILSPEKQELNPVIEQQAQAMRDKGHIVDIILIRSFVSRLEYILLISKVFKKTFYGNYDIVHAHYGLSAITTSFCWKTPVVLTLHGSDALIGKVQPAISYFFSYLSAATIGVSKKIVEFIPNCEYIPCGVDVNLFRPKERDLARQCLGMKQNVRYILFPYSPLRKVKRYDIAKKTVEILNQKGMKTELIVVSNKTSTEMVNYYNAADAMIMCSDSEGSPTAVKEALSCNTPVISIGVGDSGEILSGIPEAKLYTKDPESLAVGFEQLISKDPEMQWQSREKMKRFSLQNNANQVLQIYDKVLSSV